MAAAIIRGAGLERYYEEREEYAPRPGPLRPGWDAVPVTVCEDGSAEVRLVLDGLRCASCVWVTEHVLQATPGVEEATVSYATGRASLKWDPQLFNNLTETFILREQLWLPQISLFYRFAEI